MQKNTPAESVPAQENHADGREIKVDVGNLAIVTKRASTLSEILKHIPEVGSTSWFARDALHNESHSLANSLQQALLSHDEAATLRLAIDLYEFSHDQARAQNETNSGNDTNQGDEIDYARLAENLIRQLLTKSAPDSVATLIPDVLRYYLGLIALDRANLATSDNARREAAQHALDSFSLATTHRTSAFYHRAKEGYAKACIAGFESCDTLSVLRQFLATYPDYSETPAFLFEIARSLERAQSPDAQTAYDDLIWNYTWSEAAQKAKKRMDENGWTPRERTYQETFDHVDFLRRKRFWTFAETAVDSALAKYPDDLQLLLQNARIQYEQSRYEPALVTFEHMLKLLNGEKRDNIRPAGVIAYIYRALGYAGQCDDAIERQAENLTKLSRNDRISSRLNFEKLCGSLDKMWADTQLLGPTAFSAYDYAFNAYLGKSYEIARNKFDEAADSLSGSYRRRARYFLAQATLKSAQQKALASDNDAQQEASAAEPQPAEQSKSSTKSTASKSTKTTKSSKSKKSSKKAAPARPPLPEASVELAKKLFSQLIAEDPTDYYAIIANSRLMELDGAPKLEDSPLYMPNAGLTTISTDDEAPVRGIDDTYAFDAVQTLAGGDIDAWFHAHVEAYADIWPALKRVEALHKAGLYAERNREFRPILIEGNSIAKLSSRPVAKNLWYTSLSVDGHLVDNRKKESGYWGTSLSTTYFNLPDKKATAEREKLAAHQQAIFDNRVEIRRFLHDTAVLFHDYYMARRTMNTPKSLPGTPADNADWSTIYPHAYNHALVEASHQNGLSAYLLWTLMNIESAFNPDSISIADAYGLLQIIPMTGYKLAEALHDADFGPYDLIMPENSIRMGAWYFGQIVKKFGGYATLSMAGYNGGPFQVARWITAYGNQLEHDAFIELIPLNEARNYVKKGLARLLIFKRIDYANPNYYYYVPNTLPTSFEEMPNF